MTVTVLDLTKDCYQQGKKELNSQSVSVGFSKRQLQHVPSLAGFAGEPMHVAKKHAFVWCYSIPSQTSACSFVTCKEPRPVQR